jgi:hypothetical protein
LNIDVAFRFRPAEVGFCVEKALVEYAAAWWLLAISLNEAGLQRPLSDGYPLQPSALSANRTANL